MIDAPPAVLPLLSVCVPTFNRASGLHNLLLNLQTVATRFGTQVEICVSNNCSSDGTAAVIEKFAEPLALRVLHQERNIGGTLNMIAVAGMSRGRWAVLVGDDDELVADNISSLLDYLLNQALPGDWVLAGVASLDGQEHLLGALPAGVFGMAAFRRLMFRTSLHPFGFMGMHVFPASAKATLAALSLEQAQPWPHIAAFLRHPEEARVHVFKQPIMVQAKGGAKLFWNAADLARITLSKLRILAMACGDVRARAMYFKRLMLRELYSLPTFGLLVAWKLYEADDFNAKAVKAYQSAYGLTGALLPLVVPHALAVLLLRWLPHAALAFLFRLSGRGHFIARYADRKRSLAAFDGIKRGI